MKEYFKDFNGKPEECRPIPKVIYWYAKEFLAKNDNIFSLNAKQCNKLLNNELKNFFEKYPKELENAVAITNIFTFETNISNEEKEFYKNEIIQG